MADRSPRLVDWITLVVLAFTWGAAFFFIKRAVGVFGSVNTALWRTVLSTLLYLPIALIFWSRIPWKKWFALGWVSLLGSVIPSFLFALAQQKVNSSLAGVLNSMTPVFTLLIGFIVFKRSYTYSRIVGVVIGMGGAVLLILFNASSGMQGNILFALLCILAALSYGTNAQLVGNVFRDYHPAAVASSAFMITGPFLIAALFWTGAFKEVFENPDGLAGLGYVAYLAALGTVGGSIFFFWLIQRTSPVFATSVTYLLPVVALVIGALDGEQVGLYDLLGTGIILTGLYLIRS